MHDKDSCAKLTSFKIYKLSHRFPTVLLWQLKQQERVRKGYLQLMKKPMLEGRRSGMLLLCWKASNTQATDVSVPLFRLYAASQSLISHHSLAAVSVNERADMRSSYLC
ncbi:unnamed protein product [Pleuronectes platessa]|uniref:Uncharacterized protein n=1 Tax=Pleuronectes platessa TaxID=8262 RepID=A0A9N7UFM5_PLEPL|nr:unnamed protein product [Pleuronectes platessa]